MKKSFGLVKLILIITMSVVIIAGGCTEKSNITAVELIKNKEDIERIEIDMDNRGTENTIITNKDVMDNLLKELSAVSITKMSKDEERGFLNEGKRMLEPGMLTILLYEKGYIQSGQFMIWSNGDMCLIDLDTMTGSSRTISYISEEKQPDIYEMLKAEI